MAIAFVEPSTEKKAFMVSQMHSVDALPEEQRSEFEELIKRIWQGIDTKVRTKTNAMGNNGQNHYHGIRALTNPKSRVPGQSGAQLVGEEFFGLNRFVDELLDVADVQWWAVYKGNGWGLHERSTEGEHLECWGSWGDLQSAVVVVNGKPLSVDETYSFYRTFTNRQRNAFGKRFKRDEVQKTLDAFVKGERVDAAKIAKLEALGLIDGTELTYAGRSIVMQQTAKERKDAQKAIPLSLDHHGLTSKLEVVPYGDVSSIAHYLDDRGIKPMLERNVISEDEFKWLCSEDEKFRKKFGYSFVHESMLKLYTIDDVTNPFLKELAKDVLPKVIRGDHIIKAIVDEYKKKNSGDTKEKIRDLAEKTLAKCAVPELKATIDSIVETSDYLGSTYATLVKKQIKISLMERARDAFRSNSLEDKYDLIGILADFPDYISFNNKHKEELADKIMKLFDASYHTLDTKEKVEAAKRLKGSSSSLGKLNTLRMAEIIFSDVNSPDSLEEALKVFKAVDLRPDTFVASYFTDVFSGKSTGEKISLLKEYWSVISSNDLRDRLPKDVSGMGNLQDILFFANLLPGSLDLMMEYGKLRCNLKIQDLGNGNNISYMKTIPNHQEYVVASMFGKVDAKIISKIASHFGIEAKYFSISGGKLKVKTSLQDKDPYGMYSYNSMIKSRNTDPDIRGFVQATLFASYASAVAAGQAVSIDPNAQYACVVDLSDVTHRFGDAAPEERKYNGGGQIFFSDNPKGSEKGEKDGLGLRYKLEEYMSTNSFDSLIRPKKDLYSNFEKIIDKDYNIKINNYIFKKDWDPFGKKGL